MTKRQNSVLAVTFVACLICGAFAASAFGHHAASAARGWAVAALAFGSVFKLRSHDYGVWG
jgi:hypothetical protein